MAERVFRLSLEEGVRRVVMASSNHAADWYEEILSTSARWTWSIPNVRPSKSDNFYGWAKLAYEGLGFMYATGAQGRKLENVQVRIGAPRPIEAKQFFPNGPTGEGATPSPTSATSAPTSARAT